ncbi:hypothetical protein OIU76_023989 [Salix suchowensis]|nr:hypothetical protein OIU76_023989 [Salix suchowensis]
MEAERKQEIMDDLVVFSTAEEFYARIGRAWKRGYLLFGPPGTGKSTMIAAMANLLNYDIYDLELTAVKDNTELRKLLIDTTSRSIIVIEDIDCSLDLTGQRKKKKEEGEGDEKDPKLKLPKEESETKQSQEKEKTKAEEEEKAKEKDSSKAEENAKNQVKENGFCDKGNAELSNKEKK